MLHRKDTERGIHNSLSDGVKEPLKDRLLALCCPRQSWQHTA